MISQRALVQILILACSVHCTTFGCNATGANRCDTCDFGYGLTTNGSCDGNNNYTHSLLLGQGRRFNGSKMVRKSDLGKFNVGILHKFDSAYNCLAATVK